MNTGWRVIDCSQMVGRLSYRRGRLVVKPDTQAEQNLSLAQLAVLLIGERVSVSGAVIAKCSEYDIALVSCDWRGVPQAALYPWNEHSRIAARNIAQANLSLPRKKQAWARIIKAKIIGQAFTLRHFGSSSYEKLKKLAHKVKSGDNGNLEAQAARIYWKSLVEDKTFRRLPRSGIDGINSCLDYSYVVLRGFGIRAVVGAGLAGTLGVFHKGRSNNFALVDDLIEPFRPAVDQFLFAHLENWEVSDSESKKIMVAASNQKFDASGKSIPTRLLEFAQDLGAYVEGNMAELLVPTWKGIENACER